VSSHEAGTFDPDAEDLLRCRARQRPRTIAGAGILLDLPSQEASVMTGRGALRTAALLLVTAALFAGIAEFGVSWSSLVVVPLVLAGPLLVWWVLRRTGHDSPIRR
jgi:hypothetical protein